MEQLTIQSLGFLIGVQENIIHHHHHHHHHHLRPHPNPIILILILFLIVIAIVILACPDARCESGQTSGSSRNDIYTHIYIFLYLYICIYIYICIFVYIHIIYINFGRLHNQFGWRHTQQAPTKHALSCSSSVTEKFTKKSATWNCACAANRAPERPGSARRETWGSNWVNCWFYGENRV